MSQDASRKAARPVRGALVSLSLGALGVVFGDIGTSPLYAFKECLTGPHGVAATPANVFGVLSLIVWALTLVVTVKYLCFIMRADNHGEGGAFALLAQLTDPHREGHAHLYIFVLFGIVGAALLYGDGMVTPAISVLSAVEGLQLAAPRLQPLVLPITCVTLLGLFALQSRGTGHIGKLFGPVMLVWFVTIGGLGAFHIAKNPTVLQALSPLHAIDYFSRFGVKGGLILGSVVLAVTGGEALYADMGHFGIRPIRSAWFIVVMPALMLAYLGMGALVLDDPSAADNPFFSMVAPGLPTYALVGLASLSTVVASQALISGVFSLTKEGIQLGYLPRLTIRHTAYKAEGQIYVPFVNWALAVSCITLVLVFRESTRLASAYGIAVSGTMALTSLVYFEVIRTRWKWRLWQALPLVLAFLCLDIPFLAANAIKILDGGYVPVAVASALVVVMLIWKRGQALFTQQLAEDYEPLADFIARDAKQLVARVPGTGVYVTRNAHVVPPALQKQVRAIPALQETVIVMSVRTEHVPAVEDHERMKIEDLGCGFFLVEVAFGFMEVPRVMALIERFAVETKRPIDLSNTIYYLRRETFLATPTGKMGRLSEGLFAFLARNARPVDAYFKIPPNQVFEIGAQFDL
ncbi:MAG: Kup system potassium uptake protein [Myxococcaceae bacterium]|nr:Kup system potassium uptake protein [Myxococcaceae bacterium]